MKNKRAIYWLKRDFRLGDNPSLTVALAKCEEVIPLFICEPSFLKAPETSINHKTSENVQEPTTHPAS